jgi:hypothetical protein
MNGEDRQLPERIANAAPVGNICCFRAMVYFTILRNLRFMAWR